MAVAPNVLALSNAEAGSQQMEQANLRKKLLKPATESIPSLYKGETEDIGPQTALGPDEAKAKHQWFELSLDTQFLYTSNAFQDQKNAVDTSLLVTTAQLAIVAPTIELGNGALQVKGGYQHQKFNFGIYTGGKERTFNNADFDVSTLFVQGRYLFNENWIASFGVDYNRLLSADKGSYKEAYAEVQPKVSLDRTFKIDDKSSINVGVSSNLHLTTVPVGKPGVLDRLDEALMVSYSRELLPNLTVEPYYRIQFTQYYQTQSRNDITQSLGAAVGYSINKWASVRATFGFEHRESEVAPTYDKVDTGLGVSLQAKF